MFATLHYNPGDENMIYEALSDKPPSLNQPFSHSACFSCRDKKLKCTGEKSGCERCRKRDIVCEYAPTANDAGTGRRKSQRPASPRPISPKASLSKEDSPFTERAATEVQKDQTTSKPAPLDSVAGRGSESMPISAISNAPVSSSDFTVNASPADFSFSQMPLPNFALGDITMDSMFDSSLDIPDFGADLNLSGTKIDWNYSGLTPAEGTSIPPVLPSNEPNHVLLNSAQPQHSSSNFRIRDDRRNTPQRSRSPKSQTPSTPLTDSTSDSVIVCSCRDMALRILEALQPQRMRKPNQATLQQLDFTKNVMNQCQKILKCAHCIKVSSLMVLVCIISENLVDIFEAVMQALETKTATPTFAGDRDAKTLSRTTGSKLLEEMAFNADDQDYSFGDYRVDTGEEWLSMTRCLLLFQINRLDSILTALQKNAVRAEWESQLMILLPMFRRLKATKDKL